MASAEVLPIIVTAQDQTQAAFASVRRNVSSVAGDIGKLRGALYGLGAVQAFNVIRQQVGALDDLGDLAERVGLSTRAVQGLQFTLGQAGGDAEMAERALDKFSDTTAEAAKGGGYLAKVFAANSMSLRDSADQLKSNEVLLTDVAKLIAGAATPQEKLNLATDFFGRQAGPKMVGTLERIAREGLPELISQAERAGGVIDESLINRAGELDKQFKQAGASMDKALKELAVQAAPFAIQEINGINAAIKDVQYTIRNFDWTKIGKSLEVELFGRKFFEQADVNRRALMTRGVGTMTQGQTDSFYGAFGNRFAATPTSPGKGTVIPGNDDEAKKNEFDRAVNSITKHIALMEADARAVGQNAGEHEKLRTQAQLLDAAQRAGIPVTGKRKEEFDRLAEAAKNAANQLAALKLQDDLLFERQQIGRSPDEQNVYSRLRSSGIDANSEQGQMLASQIRLNQELQFTKDLTTDALKGFVADLRAGRSEAEAFSNVLDKIVAKLADKAIDTAISALFGAFTPGADSKGLSGFLSSIFRHTGGMIDGGGSSKAMPAALFANAPRYHTGGIIGPGERPVIAKDGEEIGWPGQLAQKYGGNTIVYAPKIDARGADAAAVARLAQAMDEDRRNFKRNVLTTVSGQRRNDPGFLRG